MPVSSIIEFLAVNLCNCYYNNPTLWHILIKNAILEGEWTHLPTPMNTPVLANEFINLVNELQHIEKSMSLEMRTIQVTQHRCWI